MGAVTTVETTVPMGSRAWHEPKQGETLQQKNERMRLIKIVQELEKKGVDATKKSRGGESQSASMDEVKQNVTENMITLMKKYGQEFVSGMLINGGMTEEEAEKYVSALRIAEKMK